MAVATKKQMVEMIAAPEDAANAKYIVRELKGDAWVENLSVGLATYKKSWKLEHVSEDDFYDHILQPAAQSMLNVGVRVANAKDLEKFGDQILIKELVQKHTHWDKEQEKLKTELRAQIIEWVKENVTTEEQLKTFLTQNGVNTNQLNAMAYGARHSVLLSDEFVEMFAGLVEKKSAKTQHPRKASDVIANFYVRKEK